MSYKNKTTNKYGNEIRAHLIGLNISTKDIRSKIDKEYAAQQHATTIGRLNYMNSRVEQYKSSEISGNRDLSSLSSIINREFSDFHDDFSKTVGIIKEQISVSEEKLLGSRSDLKEILESKISKAENPALFERNKALEQKTRVDIRNHTSEIISNAFKAVIAKENYAAISSFMNDNDIIFKKKEPDFVMRNRNTPDLTGDFSQDAESKLPTERLDLDWIQEEFKNINESAELKVSGEGINQSNEFSFAAAALRMWVIRSAQSNLKGKINEHDSKILEELTSKKGLVWDGAGAKEKSINNAFNLSALYQVLSQKVRNHSEELKLMAKGLTERVDDKRKDFTDALGSGFSPKPPAPGNAKKQILNVVKKWFPNVSLGITSAHSNVANGVNEGVTSRFRSRIGRVRKLTGDLKESTLAFIKENKMTPNLGVISTNKISNASNNLSTEKEIKNDSNPAIPHPRKRTRTRTEPTFGM